MCRDGGAVIHLSYGCANLIKLAVMGKDSLLHQHQRLNGAQINFTRLHSIYVEGLSVLGGKIHSYSLWQR